MADIQPRVRVHRAPDPPQNFRVVQTRRKRVPLVWSPLGPTAAEIEVQRAVDADGQPGSFTSAFSTPRTIVGKADHDVAPGAAWHYRARSVNAYGTSPWVGPVRGVVAGAAAPPQPPSDLAVVAASATQINGSFADNSDNESTFEVQASTDGGQSWTQVLSLAANTTSFAHSGLTPLATYRYRVRAVNTYGRSAWSNIALAATLQAAPTAPTGLQVTASTSRSATLAWTAPSRGPVSSYRVRRSPAGAGAFVEVGSVGGTVTTLVDANLAPETSYDYRVRARNATGDSPDSDPISVTTAMEPPGTPQNLSAAAASSSAIALTWAANSTAGTPATYLVERSVTANTWVEIAQVAAPATGYTDANLSQATPYTYRVRARNLAGLSGYSNQAGATTNLALPTAPSNLAATALSVSTIGLAWSAGSGGGAVESFRIERSVGGGAFAEIAATQPGTLTYTDSGLASSTTYTYRAVARNATGDSAPSGTAAATTLLAPPAAPSALAAVAASDTAVSLSWSAGVGSGGAVATYRIERATGGGSYAEIGSVSGGTTAYSDTGLTGSTTYTYRVRARNASGDSAYSNTASATTLAMSAPAAPTTLAVSQVSPSAVFLSWAAGSGGGTIATYRIERSATGANAFAEIGSVAAGTTAYVDRLLPGLTGYDYRVRARNAGGDSGYSGTVTGTTTDGTGQAPSAPESTAVSASTTTTVTLTWLPGALGSTAKEHLVQSAPAGSNTWTTLFVTSNATTLTYTATGLSAGTAYDFRLRSRGVNGMDSAWTATVTTTTPAASLAAPSALSVVAVSSAQINGSFTDNSSGETGFEVETSANGTTGWALALTLAANATSFSHTGLSASTTYYYRVRATGSPSNSGYSNVANATTQAGFQSPPAAPTSLAAVGTGSGSIGLSWAAGSGGGAAATYRVERSATGAATWLEVGSVAGTATSYADSGLVDGTSYDYRVRARNTAGDSAYSATATAAAGAPAGSPTPPSNLQVASTTPSAVGLSWSAGSNVATYRVERSTGGGAYAEVGQATAGTTTFTDPLLASATTYSYRVRARNLSGDSAYAPAVTATTGAFTYPSAPTGFTATALTKSSVALAWTPGILGGAPVSHLIQRSPAGANTWTDVIFLNGGGTSSYTATGLAGSTAYDFRIRSRNAAADSGWATASATTLEGGLDAPSNLLVAAAGTSSISGSFTDNSAGETGFSVERSPDGSTGWAEALSLGAGVTAFTDTGLDPGTTYSYRVRAMGTPSPSGYSATASATTTAIVVGPPSAPTGLAATTTSSSTVALSWTAGAGGGTVTSYRVERAPAGSSSFAEIGLTTGATAYGDTGLDPATTYRYRVRARNAQGDSAYAGPVDGQTAAPGSIPAPTNVQVAAVDGRLEVSFEDPNDGAATPVVEYSTDAGASWSTAGEVSPGTTWALTPDLGRSQAAQVRVKAVGPGGSSPYSAVVNASTLPAGQVGGTRPVALLVAAAGPTSLACEVITTSYASGASHSYTLFEYGTDGVTFPSSVQGDGSALLTGLAPDTTYYVRARDRMWYGALSTATPAVAGRTYPTSLDFGTAPTGCSASLTADRQITVTWTNSSPSLAILLERSHQGPTPGGELPETGWFEAARLPAGTNAYVDAGLEPHCYYTYRVRHVSEGGWSAVSNCSPELFTGARAYTSAAPGRPASLDALPSRATEAYLWWTVNDDLEESFELQQSLAGQDTWTAAGLATSGAATVPRLWTSCYVGGLAAETAYDFRIRAVNSAGASAWRQVASAVTTLAAGRTWAYDGTIDHAPRLLVNPRWKQGMLQGKADYLAGRQTTARYAYERLAQAGTWPANGYWPYLHSWMVLYYALTGDSAVAQRAYQAFDVGTEAMGQPYNSNGRRMFGATGTISAVTNSTTIRVAGLPTDLVSRLYVATSLGGLVDDRVTFNTGANAAADQPGWLIAAATQVDASTYDLTLKSAPAEAMQVGDSLTIFHRYQWWQNEVRDRSVEMIAAYELLYPALDPAQRLKFLNFLNNLIDLAVGVNTTTGDRKTSRIDDSDAIMGSYMGAALLDVITAPLGNPRAGTFLARDWRDDSNRAFPAGGFARTSGAIRSTYRNAVGQYADSSRSGEWVESTMYNGGTMLYAIWGTAGLAHALGVEHFPEYAELKRTYAATMIQRWASNLNYMAKWGDEQFSTGSVRKLQGVHVIWLSSAAYAGAGDLRYEPYLAEMLHQMTVVFPGTAKDPFSQGRAQQPRYQYLQDFTTPRAPMTGAGRVWASPARVRRLNAFHRAGWSDNDAYFYSMSFGDTMVDHNLHALNPWELNRNQERVFSGYQGYSGGFLYANYREEGYPGGVITGGLLRGEINGALGHEALLDDYVYTSGTHYGRSVFEASARPPANQLERTRRMFYFPSTTRTSDVVVMHDRVLMRNPFRIQGVGGHIKQTYSSSPGLVKVKASPTPTTTAVPLVLESSYANKWQYFRIWFKSGRNAGVARYVAACTQGSSSTVATLDRPLPYPPAAGDFCHMMRMDSQQAWLQRQVDYDLAMVEQCIPVPPGRAIDLSTPNRVAWTTAGGQLATVDHLLPEVTTRDATSVVTSRSPSSFFGDPRYQDNTAAEDYDNPSENQQQVRVMPAVKWPLDDRPARTHFLAVWSGADAGTLVTSALVRSSAGAAVEAAHVRRPGEDDLLVAFGAAPVDRTLRSTFTLSWTAVRPSTRLYLADLDPRLTWRIAVDGGSSQALAVSANGVARAVAPGSGARTVVLTAT